MTFLVKNYFHFFTRLILYQTPILKLFKIGAGQSSAPTSHRLKLKFGFTHFQSFLGCFHALGEIFDSAEFFVDVSIISLRCQSSNCYQFLITYLFQINDPSLESYSNVLYEFLCFSKESRDFISDVSSFSVILRNFAL